MGVLPREKKEGVPRGAAKPVTITTMKKPLLAVLAVAAVAVVAIFVVVENTPERRMDRRIDKLLRTYDDPKQLYQRVVDDRDLLGFFLVELFLESKGLDHCSCPRTASRIRGSSRAHKEDCDYTTYLTQHHELFDDFWSQIAAELCDCGIAPSLFSITEEGDFTGHRPDCNLTRDWQDIHKTRGPYMLRKRKEFREEQLNR